MRRVTQVVTGADVSTPVPANPNISPFNIGFGCEVSLAATVAYTVEHTFDDVFDPAFDAATAVWFAHPTVAGATGNADGNYAFPIAAYRLNVASSDGTVTMKSFQAGI